MKSLAERIMEYAGTAPEATPICPSALLHFGRRGAVNQALSRLARSGQLLRICQGVYMRPIQTRFGLCAPSLEQAITALASLWGETIVSNGGDAANWLGLTTPERRRYGLSDFRSRPTPAFRGTPGQTAPCSALATGGRTWNRRHRHPGDLMARSPRGREESGCRAAEALARLAFAFNTGRSDAFSRRQKE